MFHLLSSLGTTWAHVTLRDSALWFLIIFSKDMTPTSFSIQMQITNQCYRSTMCYCGPTSPDVVCFFFFLEQPTSFVRTSS